MRLATTSEAQVFCRAVGEVSSSLLPNFGDCRVEWTRYRLTDLRSAIDQVEEVRLKHARELLASIRLQLPTWTPWSPVVGAIGRIDAVLCETTSEGVMLIDGVHRVVASQLAGMDSVVTAHIVWNSVYPPPCQLIDIINISTYVGHIEPKFVNKRNELFRPGENIQRMARMRYNELQGRN